MSGIFTSSTFLVIMLLSGCTALPDTASGPSPYKLPMRTIFKGERKFNAIVHKAEREEWSKLPLGQRTMKVAEEMLGTPYENFTLEVHDHIEAPVVNFKGLDCWTFYENALAIARMLHHQKPPYRPVDMLRMVELERYRDGHCDHSYLSRMHHLEEVFFNNEQRDLALNITRQLPGAERLWRNIQEMTQQWESYRYLRSNTSLLKPMAKLERKLSRLPVFHIPKNRVRLVESHLQDGDICAITTKLDHGYTSHVGLIQMRNNRAWFVHATSEQHKGRRCIVDTPITNYLYQYSKHAGIIICRPKDLASAE